MRPERRTPRPQVSLTSALATRYAVSRRLAQLAVSRDVHRECAEIADQADNPHQAFLAAAQVLAYRPALPKLPLLAELLERCGRSS